MIENDLRRIMPAVEDRAFRDHEGALTRFALIPLRPFTGLSKFADIPAACSVIIRASRVFAGNVRDK